MNIAKPISRHPLRRSLGKFYYTQKRKLLWLWSKKRWAKNRCTIPFDFEVKNHQSFIMRPLKDVEMYLQENKKTNLRLAIKKLDGIIIGPGETFSFWKLVGKPSATKGYLEGLVLNQGAITKGIGGGLCQLGNLLFWMVAHSPLTITERYRHGFDVFPDVNRTIPFGAGATLSYNYIDFQFKNETNNTYHLHLWLDETYLNGKLTSKEAISSEYILEERNHQIVHQYWGGYTRHNQIFRLQQTAGQLTEEKLLVENNAIMMYEPLLTRGKSL